VRTFPYLCDPIYPCRRGSEYLGYFLLLKKLVQIQPTVLFLENFKYELGDVIIMAKKKSKRNQKCIGAEAVEGITEEIVK